MDKVFHISLPDTLLPLAFLYSLAKHVCYRNNILGRRVFMFLNFI